MSLKRILTATNLHEVTPFVILSTYTIKDETIDVCDALNFNYDRENLLYQQMVHKIEDLIENNKNDSEAVAIGLQMIEDYSKRASEASTVNIDCQKKEVDFEIFKRASTFRLRERHITKCISIPRIFSKKEQKAFAQLTGEKFKILIENDTRCLLEAIGKFKPYNKHFVLPYNMSIIAKEEELNSLFELSDDELIGRLQILYQKVLIVYSFVFSDKINDYNYKKEVLKHMKLVKIALGYLLVIMGRKNIRFNTFRNYFEEFFPSKCYGVGSSKALEDILEDSDFYFQHLNDRYEMFLLTKEEKLKNEGLFKISSMRKNILKHGHNLDIENLPMAISKSYIKNINKIDRNTKQQPKGNFIKKKKLK